MQHAGFTGTIFDRFSKMMVHPLAARLANGALWSITGAVLARGLTLLGSIFVARLLGVTGFGELGIVQSTLGMFSSLAGCGLALTATKHIAEFRKTNACRAGRVVGLCYIVGCATGAFAMAATIALSPWLARETLAAPHLTGFLRMGAAIVFFGMITGVQTGILAGFEAFKHAAFLAIGVSLAAFPMLMLGVLWWGVPGAVGALTANLGLSAVLNHMAIRQVAKQHQIEIRFVEAAEEIGVLRRFTAFALLGGLMGVPLNWICNSILINQVGGCEQMGIFTAANQWRMMVLFIPATIGSVALPLMANLHGQGDHRRFRKMLWFTVLLNGGAASLLAIPLIATAPFILSLYGEHFVAGRIAFVVLILAAVVLAVNNGLSRAIASIGAMRADLSAHVTWGASFLAASWILIPHYGATGLAMATLLGAVFQSICQWIWLLRYARGSLNCHILRDSSLQIA